MPQKKQNENASQKELPKKVATAKQTASKKTVDLEQTVSKKVAAKSVAASSAPDDVIPALASFGRSRVVLILRDNHWAFAYWEIGGDGFNGIRNDISAKKREIASLVLRVVAEDGSGFFDISLNKFASSWYFQPNMSGKNIFVELLIVDTAGDYYKLSTSNTLAIPGSPHFAQLQDKSLLKWRDSSGKVNNDGVPFDEKSYNIFIESLGGERVIRERIGSEEFLTHLKDKLFSGELISSQILSSIISSGISSLVSSFVSSGESFGNIKIAKPKAGESDDGFWLVAGTELILFGATEPDADLYVSKKKIELKEDGSFMLRMPLPDGQIDLPVEAYSKNKRHYRSITPKVKKWTE